MKRNKAYTIGITGGVGSGKSLALDYLKLKYNCALIKADDIGNEVKLKGRECYKDIISLLGEDILSEDGEIDKCKMAEKIFADDSLVNKVNDIIHPAVRKVIEKEIEDLSDEYEIIILEAALLAEAGYFPILNELWEISADKEIRIKRLTESRNYSLEKCESIISKQHDTEFYSEADKNYRKSSQRNDYFGFRVILNNTTKEDLYDQIDIAMEEVNERIR
ncbi:MAG: dephospho-CoA kinase [Lachnospiraceae bacterium]|nr:dephospho-CoA kinase [Lachnospiraceae bacterium]